MSEKRVCLVTNRSASRVCYSVPELGIRLRDFQPGETKRISYDELQGLTYVPGGLALMRDFLQMQEHCLPMIVHCGSLVYIVPDGMERKRAMPSMMQSLQAMSSCCSVKP